MLATIPSNRVNTAEVQIKQNLYFLGKLPLGQSDILVFPGSQNSKVLMKGDKHPTQIQCVWLQILWPKHKLGSSAGPHPPICMVHRWALPDRQANVAIDAHLTIPRIQISHLSKQLSHYGYFL